MKDYFSKPTKSQNYTPGSFKLNDIFSWEIHRYLFSLSFKASSRVRLAK